MPNQHEVQTIGVRAHSWLYFRAQGLSRLKSPRAFFRWFYRYRSLRLTSEGFWFVLFALAVGIAAMNTGNNLLYLLLAMMLGLIVVSGVLSEKCLKELSIQRRLPAHLFAGLFAVISLRVTNEKRRFPSFSLRIIDVIAGASQKAPVQLFHLRPKASLTQSYRLLFPRRGCYRIDAIKISTRFPFGLFVKTATLPQQSEVVAYPAPEPLPEALVHALEAMGHDRETSRRGPGSGLYNLRDYQSGDDSRSVHWKTSARQSRLMVRETEAEDQRLVTLALPVRGACDGQSGKPDANEGFERAVVLTASLAAYFRRQGFAMRLLVGDEELPCGTGENHFYRMLRMLAICRSSMEAVAPIPPSFLTLSNHAARGEFVLLILPWEDHNLRVACRGVTRILETWA